MKFLFNKVAIIGVGLLGGSLGLALKRKKIAQLVIGLGRNKNRLTRAIEKRAIDEMRHAEKLAARILLLEGHPILRTLKMNTGAEIESQLKNDRNSKREVIRSYNDGIELATQWEDNGTRNLFESILIDERNHIDLLDAELDQIKKMGIQNYRVEKVA